VVSFGGVHSATSSFVNSAFVPLLDDISLDDLKRRVRVVRSSRQINDMIKTRLTRERTPDVRRYPPLAMLLASYHRCAQGALGSVCHFEALDTEVFR
jgi:hypothetical protein